MIPLAGKRLLFAAILFFLGLLTTPAPMPFFPFPVLRP